MTAWPIASHWNFDGSLAAASAPPRARFGSAPRWLGAAAGALMVAAVQGCTPKIGDSCTTSVDCSQQGDRLCDTSQPNGYCTMFGCEPDTCPEGEGDCVAFDSELDPACHGTDATEWGRFERTFCMKSCDDDGDCRNDDTNHDGIADYQCVAPGDIGALIVDAKPNSKKVCVARTTQPHNADMVSVDGGATVCQPGVVDGGLKEHAPDGAAGGGGAGGSGTGGTGTGGMGGVSGSGGANGGAGGTAGAGG